MLDRTPSEAALLQACTQGAETGEKHRSVGNAVVLDLGHSAGAVCRLQRVTRCTVQSQLDLE